MKRFRICALAGLATLSAPPAPGSDGAPTALAVFDAWLATAARTDPRWRTEIRAEPAAVTPPPGRYLARSPVLGTFSYRPKAYAELKADERLQLLREPAFRRRLQPGPGHKRRLHFAIPPEEMRQNRPFVYTLPPP